MVFDSFKMSDHRLIGPILPPSFRNNQLNNVSCSDDDSQDVINSSERSDDNLIGPVLPTKDKPSESEVKRYGPSIPDCFKNQDIEENSNDDDYEEYGPALPLSLQNNKSISKDENVDYTQNDGNDSDSDDNMIGPMPDGLVDKNHMYDASIRLQKSKKDITKREKWMLEPPKALKSTLQTKSVTKFSQKSSKIKDKPLSEEERIELEASKEKEQIMEDFLDKYSKVSLYLYFWNIFAI